MPKVSRVGKSRNKLVVDAAAKHEICDDAEAKRPAISKKMSKGQRKRLLKRQQYLKREQMVLSTLQVKRLEDQKGRLDGMDAMKDALTQTMKKNQQLSTQSEGSMESSIESAKSNKTKKDIAQKELSHLNLVLQHPSFQTNPFETMQEHLRNSLAKQAEQQEITAKAARIQEAKDLEDKKEARKERIRNAKFERGRKKNRRR